MKKLFLIVMSTMLVMPVLLPVFAEKEATNPSGIRNNIRKQTKQDIQESKKDPGQNLRKSIFGQSAKITNGQVTAISGATLTVTKDNKIYTVNTDSKTQFRRHFWGKSSLSEISVNDMVNILGKFTNDARTIIQATLVKNLSIEKRAGVFFGTVTATTGSGFTISTINRGTQTIAVSAGTKFINREGRTLKQSDIKTGHRIRVRGLWDKKNNTIAEVTEIKDFSLPAKVETK